MNFHNSDGKVVNRCRTQTVIQEIRDGCRPAILLSDYGVSVLSLKIFNFSEKHLLIHTIGQTVVLVSIVSRISVRQYFYFSDRLTFHLLFNTTASILLFLTGKHKKTNDARFSVHWLQGVLHAVGCLLPAGPPQPLQDKI